MKVGMGAMALRPKDFWNITFSEFWAIYDSKFGHIPEHMTKNDLKKMMTRFPD